MDEKIETLSNDHHQIPIHHDNEKIEDFECASNISVEQASIQHGTKRGLSARHVIFSLFFKKNAYSIFNHLFIYTYIKNRFK